MEYLYLKWVDYETDKKYILGALCRDKKNNIYYFKLSEDYISKVKEIGFLEDSLPFSDVNKIYESNNLFPFFLSRVPQIENLSEEELHNILKELGLKKFDEFEYLKKTKGELITDYFILEENRE